MQCNAVQHSTWFRRFNVTTTSEDDFEDGNAGEDADVAEAEGGGDGEGVKSITETPQLL